jgi:hypothetical protein
MKKLEPASRNAKCGSEQFHRRQLETYAQSQTKNVFRENSIAKFLKPKTYWSHRKTNPDYILIQVEKQPNFLI